MPTSAATSPQLAVYAKLLCLLMVVICGVAVPMEQKVRLFNVKTKGFMETSRRGTVVSASNRNVTVSKFTNLTIRSTSELGGFGVVELVFGDLSPQRRLCIDNKGNLKGMKRLSHRRRQPGCLFRECVDGNYFFYLTTQHRPRLLGFQGPGGHARHAPPGPAHCCRQDGEHLVRDALGFYSCERRRAHHGHVDSFFFLKKRQDNETLADLIPEHNARHGGYSGLLLAAPPAPASGASASPAPVAALGGREDAGPGRERAEDETRHSRRTKHRTSSTSTSTTTTTTTTTTTLSPKRLQHHGQHRGQHKQQRKHKQQQQLLQPKQEPHPTRHHHHLTPQQPLRSRPGSRPGAVRVRHRSKAVPQPYYPPQQDAGVGAGLNHLPWD